MSDLVTQAKDTIASTLTKVDDALAAAAPTSSGSSEVPDPITGTSHPDPPARKPSTASEEIAKVYDHRQEHKAELLGRGVLKDDKVAPALQAKQEALRRAQLGDTLETQLKARPAPEELIKEGILNQDEDPTSPV